MSQGLLKILDAIAKEPGNVVLRDRFLTLVSEMPDGMDKAQSVLNLAKLMQEIEPEYSLRLAYFVHQYDRTWVPALKFIAAVFTQMSRPGKAEVILNHIETLKKNKDQTFQPLKTTFPKNLKSEIKSQFNAEESIVASIEDYKKKLLVKEADFSEDYSSYGRFDVNEASVVQKIPKNDDVQRTHAHLFTESSRKNLDKKPEFTPTFVLDDDANLEVKKPNRVMSPPPITPPPRVHLEPKQAPIVPPKIPKIDFTGDFDQPFVKSEIHNREDVLVNPDDVKGFIFDNDDQAEVPLNRKVESNFQIEPFETHKKVRAKPVEVKEQRIEQEVESSFRSEIKEYSRPADSLERNLKIPEELFDFYWKQGFIEKAEKILLQSERFAHEKLWWQERMLLLSRYTSREEKGEIDELTLSDDLREWRIKIKKMINSGKIRKSYFEIYQAVDKSDDLDLGIVAYDFLIDIWDRLGLRGFDWKKSNGMLGLKECLGQRSMPTLSVIACGERL